MFMTANVGGNVHEAVQFVNSNTLMQQYLFQVVALQPATSCILVFKVPSREDRAALRTWLGQKPEEL